MGAYDSGFGAGLIATWLTSLLLGVGFAQAFRYFRKFPNDNLFKKCIVALVLVLLVVASAMECAEMYMHVVRDWGKPMARTVHTWPPLVFVICNTLTGNIVNQFLVHRFYAVSKNLWMTLILCLLNLGSLVMSLIGLSLLANYVDGTATSAETRRIIPVSAVWTSISVIADVAIALSLVWTLRGMQTSFRGSTQLIQHIIAVSIQNGCTTSACAIATLIANVLVPENKVDELFYFLTGPLYLLTLLSNLTLRESAQASRGWSSYETNMSRNSHVAFGGVHVHRSVITDSDTSNDSEAAREEEYDDSTVRGTSDDVEAARRESKHQSTGGYEKSTTKISAPEKVHVASRVSLYR
ncbi:hypothetical protein C8R46DRAFT_375026 [Mycena filopes]|nr:hypothetical protein C8R46DRAFT_375026 [Mycena filopes]